MAEEPERDFLGAEDLFDDDFDPACSPPDGPDRFLNDLPAEFREPYLTEPWTGAEESVAAGELQRV
jgi:hypothetical protein